MMLFKDIHIGELIQKRVKETGFSSDRLLNFMQCSHNELSEMYKSKSLDAEVLLKWSKLLTYDFFRIYSQHLLLYSPPLSSDYYQKSKQEKTQLPEFRKNIYTVEMIDFILNLLKTNEKTKQQIIEDYKIPKTTLYKWIKKY
ncbi:transcriptional regulator with XRE-family HTH domain [Chryseobacterium sediminis]|uniref:Transcriptional regulator with XRE-family HTH domain n=2 Tax=Chryseobacterium sediminis TaxID=1679494 RepID=A0ABR6PYV7_9FLAO|nr:transcriptional regulator with XRE-family HTH domain [Chryseobacterium sediminis]